MRRAIWLGWIAVAAAAALLASVKLGDSSSSITGARGCRNEAVTAGTANGLLPCVWPNVHAPIAASAATPAATLCPSSAIVSRMLDQRARTPIATETSNMVICEYPGTATVRALWTQITFWPSTASQFAFVERLAVKRLYAGARVVAGSGLSQGAWTTGSPDITFFNGDDEAIEIWAPALRLSTSESIGTGRVEALARTLD